MNKLNLWHDLRGFPLLDWPFAQMPVQQQQDNYTGSIPFCFIDCTAQDTLSLANTTTKFNWGKQARVNSWLQHLHLVRSIQAIGSGILKVIEQQIQKCTVCFTWWYHKTTKALNLLLGVTSWGFTNRICRNNRRKKAGTFVLQKDLFVCESIVNSKKHTWHAYVHTGHMIHNAEL